MPGEKLTGWITAMVLGAWLWAVAGQAAEIEPAARSRSTIATVRGLPRNHIIQTPRVLIRGVVTYVHQSARALFIQDETAGSYVSFSLAASRGLWLNGGIPADVTAGVEVEIDGVIDPGGFSPPILPASIRVLGRKPLPAPQPIDPERFFTGADDSSLVEVEGLVQDVISADQVIRLSLLVAGQPLLAEGPRDRFPADATSLINATVRVAGPAASVFNTRGEFIMPRIYIGRREWLEVVTPSPHEPFTSPHYAISDLAGFQLNPSAARQIRTEGVVIHAEPGRVIYLQSGAGGVRVKTRSTLPLQPGDEVEVAGFVERTGPVAGLTHGLVRSLGTGPPPRPIRIRPAEIILINQKAAEASLMAQPGDYQGCLVQFPARFIEAGKTAAGGGLVLAADQASVFATAPDRVLAALSGLEPGSDLMVTGITELGWTFDPSAWPPRLPTRLQLLLRSAADVQVLRTPSWWTPWRLTVLVGAIGLGLAATLGWVWLLRHELATQKNLLATEMHSRRDAALEFEATLTERNRLAANLHDTLLQTLGGIGFQLDACEGSRRQDEAEARLHFDVARRMVSHASNELHQSVWAMRTLPLGDESFPEALQTLTDRLAEGHTATVSVHASGAFTEIPDFVAGNLLLIMQEAVTNALRHGHPATITVNAEEHPLNQAVTLRVADNGVGFDPTAAATLAQGHFGLHGMRERAERLGGSLQIVSLPGLGTTVTAVVQTRDYDRQIGGAASAASINSEDLADDH